MLKKYLVFCGLGAFLFTSMSSHAQTAPTHANPSLPTLSHLTITPTPAAPNPNTIFGSLEGTLAFCTSAYPQGASTYRFVDQLITNGQSASAVAQGRNSDAYENAYQQTMKQLRSLPSAQAVAECKPH